MNQPADTPAIRPRLVPLPVMAMLAGVSRRTMFKLIADGVVPRVCLGHRTHLYDPDDVIASIKKHFGEGYGSVE